MVINDYNGLQNPVPPGGGMNNNNNNAFGQLPKDVEWKQYQQVFVELIYFVHFYPLL